MCTYVFNVLVNLFMEKNLSKYESQNNYNNIKMLEYEHFLNLNIKGRMEILVKTDYYFGTWESLMYLRSA